MSTEALWRATDEFIDRARDIPALRYHGVQLLAARRLRALGGAVPEELLNDERLAAANELAVARLLRLVREAVTGPIVIIKGPVAAGLYPDERRPYGDLDVLVPDPRVTQHQLIAVGFTQTKADYGVDKHHEAPLSFPGLPTMIEVHRRLPGPRWASYPPIEALETEPVFDGYLTLRPAQHAVVLAAHSWEHQPFRRFLDFLDVQLVSTGVEEQAASIARAWGLAKTWDATERTAGVLFRCAAASQSMRLLGRHLLAATEPTLTASRVGSYARGATGPTGALLSTAARCLAADLRGQREITARQNLRRIALGARQAARPLSEASARRWTR